MHRRTAGFESLPSHCCSTRTQLTVHFTFIHMFITVSPRTSDAVAQLQVDPLNAVAFVEFTNGYAYEYTNVSRRAIANLLLNPNMSLGFWVNKNLVNTKRCKVIDSGYMQPC